jgi:hypothetical protein
MDADFTTIRDGLRRLRESSTPPCDAFGQVHRFRINPPLTEQEVAVFEARHRITFPADYRGFLIHVGNGGAGPAYGLFPLGTTGDTSVDPDPWEEGDRFIGVLSEPFPHTRPWNDLTGKPAFNEDREDEQEWEDEYNRRLSAWEETYFNPANINGAIPICHLGCALRQWLVITGPEAGSVWDDLRADYNGLRPTGFTFFQWYRSWLDGLLRQMR